MEQRGKHAPSIDLQSAGARPSAAALAAGLDSVGEFAVAIRGGRSYSLQLGSSVAPRPRAAPRVRSALVTGGSKVDRLRLLLCHGAALCLSHAPLNK